MGVVNHIVRISKIYIKNKNYGDFRQQMALC